MSAIKNTILPGLLITALVILAPACSDGDGGDNFIVPGSGEVDYQVSFVGDWSAMTHPDYYPSSAHFSPLFIVTHNASSSFWMEGELASAGIKQMAESGVNTNLHSEAEIILQQANADNYFSGSGLNSSTATLNFSLPVNSSYPLVTIVSMLAPSSDWFVGVSGLDLYPNGIWVDDLTVDLFTYDAGTAPTSPAVPVFKITTTPFLVSNNVVPVGRLIFTREVAP